MNKAYIVETSREGRQTILGYLHNRELAQWLCVELRRQAAFSNVADVQFTKWAVLDSNESPEVQAWIAKRLNEAVKNRQQGQLG